jgi:hypothetical protein
MVIPAATEVATAFGAFHGEASRAIAAGARLAFQAPPPWAALLGGAGIVFLLHGARKRMVLAMPGGAVLGLLAAWVLVIAWSGPGAHVQGELLAISAGVGALLCAVWPPIFPLLALAIPAAVLGWHQPLADRPWLGAVAWGAVGGALGAVLREWVASLAAGGIGAAATLAGALGLLARRPIALELAGRPMVLFAAWSVLAVAGAAFHAGRAWPPPDRGGSRPGEAPHDPAVLEFPEADR